MYLFNKNEKTGRTLLVLVLLVVISFSCAALYAQNDNLVIENSTINNSEVYSAQSIAVGPDVTIESNGDLTLNSNTLVIQPRFFILSNGRLNVISTAMALNVEQDISNRMPDKFKVEQNYPNPFNPQTTIAYELANSGLVRIDVYDILGQKVNTLVNEKKQAGYHAVRFNAGNLPSGIYYYTVQAGLHKKAMKMMLVK